MVSDLHWNTTGLLFEFFLVIRQGSQLVSWQGQWQWWVVLTEVGRLSAPKIENRLCGGGVGPTLTGQPQISPWLLLISNSQSMIRHWVFRIIFDDMFFPKKQATLGWLFHQQDCILWIQSHPKPKWFMLPWSVSPVAVGYPQWFVAFDPITIPESRRST